MNKGGSDRERRQRHMEMYGIHIQVMYLHRRDVQGRLVGITTSFISYPLLL